LHTPFLQKIRKRLEELEDNEQRAVQEAKAAAAAANRGRSLLLSAQDKLGKAQAAEVDLLAAQQELQQQEQELMLELEHLKEKLVGPMSSIMICLSCEAAMLSRLHLIL